VRSSQPFAPLSIALALALTTAACEAGTVPRPSVAGDTDAVSPGAPTTMPAPESTIPGESSGLEPDPTGLSADIVAAMAWRRATGLRSDPAWIEQVAADPDASESWAFPITPAEEHFIWDRQARFDGYLGPIQGYVASHADEFGGLYIDNATSRIATLWTAHEAEHRAALLALLGDGAPVEVLPARWTEARLRQLQESITIDAGWFRELDAVGQGFGVDVTRNILTIDISSANPDAPRRIAERIAATYGVPREMIDVTSDGTGVELLATGTVTGRVVLADGSGPGANELRVDGVPDGVGYCGGGDIAFGVGAGGRFEIPCKMGSYTMVVMVPTGEGEKVVGQAHVTVGAGETTTVRITLVQGARVRG
jgi:hypothetical protein